MTLKLANLELLDIDPMTRPELLDCIQTSRVHLPDDLVTRTEAMPVDHLRLLLLAARLICVLRHLQIPLAADDPDKSSPLEWLHF